MPWLILSVSSSSCGWLAPSSAARRRTSSVSRSYVVAPQLHAQRVLLGGREDVDDAAAHGELPALLDQVDAGVGGVGEPADEVLEGGAVTRGQLDRLQVAQPLDLRLEHRADRRDDHVDRPVARLRPGVEQPAQDRQPSADGVAAGAEPLVRQRLPAGVVGDPVWVHQVAEVRDEVLGLARGRGHREDAAPGAHQTGRDEGPQGLGAGEVQRAHPGAAGVLEGSGEGRVVEDGSQQVGGQVGGHLTPGAQHESPLSWDDGGCGLDPTVGPVAGPHTAGGASPGRGRTARASAARRG